MKGKYYCRRRESRLLKEKTLSRHTIRILLRCYHIHTIVQQKYSYSRPTTFAGPLDTESGFVQIHNFESIPKQPQSTFVSFQHLCAYSGMSPTETAHASRRSSPSSVTYITKNKVSKFARKSRMGGFFMVAMARLLTQ